MEYILRSTRSFKFEPKFKTKFNSAISRKFWLEKLPNHRRLQLLHSHRNYDTFCCCREYQQNLCQKRLPQMFDNSNQSQLWIIFLISRYQVGMSFAFYNFLHLNKSWNQLNYKIRRWRAWDLNPGLQNELSKWIHWAMGAWPWQLWI